jgi:hypothetical protein
MPKAMGKLVAFLVFAIPCLSLAQLEDVEKAQELSRSQYIQRFTEFTKDKNVMGPAQSPDGKVLLEGNKSRFNADDKGTFKSDLTYHDFMYETDDEAFNKKQEAAEKNGTLKKEDEKTRRLYAGTSPHGSLSDSSQLERIMYQLHEKFSKLESEKERKQEQNKEGIRYESFTKVETKEIFKQDDKVANAGSTPPATPPPSAQGEGKKDEIPEKVSRRKIREEAISDVEKVGTDSTNTIEESAKDKDKKQNPEAMGNLEFFYLSARRGLEAMWNSTLANLGQRRAYRGATGDLKLNEDTASCDKWAQQAIAQIKTQDPKARENEVERINKMKGECGQLAKTNFRDVNPRFEVDKNDKSQNPQPKLVNKGPKDEDEMERDLRVQLEVMDKVGTRANEVPTNWKYEEKDEKASVATGYDQDGEVKTREELRMDEQVGDYNNELKESAKDTEEIKKRYPDLKMNPKDILSYQIPLKTKSALDITKFPEQSKYEDFQPQGPKGQELPVAESYQELLDQPPSRQQNK